VITGTTAFCPGGSTILDAGNTDAGGNFISYLWNPGGATTQTITIGTPALYSVTVTNVNGCPATSTPVNIIQYTPPSPVVSGNLSVCTGGSTTLDAGGGYTAYLWSNNETTQTILVTSPGSYSVNVTDSHGCSGTSATVVVTQSAGLTPVISGNLSSVREIQQC